MRLQDKVCLVTGAGSGIGEATALLFAREGGRVAVVDKDSDSARETAESIRKEGGDALAVTADVSSSSDVGDMVSRVQSHYGRIDALVNNAGYGIARTVMNTSEEEWDRLIDVNLKGVFLVSKHVLEGMITRGSGVIVNVASTVSFVGITNRAAYCASKGGIASLTRAMALDHVDQGIRVNAIAPGTIDSPYMAKNVVSQAPDQAEAVMEKLKARQAMGRLGRPEEVAYGILYLACDESSFCTGSILTVDGGWTAH